jgi:hypothetical protein
MSVALDRAIPLRVAPTRTVKLGGERFANEKIFAELAYQTLSDIRSFVALITKENIAEQKALGNPPQVLEVDGQSARPIDDVQKKTRTLFGTQLAAAAMREVEAALASAISRSTTSHTGRLQDVSGNWGWIYLPKGGAARRVTAGQDLGTFGLGDRLVLMPLQVPYATLVNRSVARSGRANVAPRSGKVSKRAERLAKSKQNRGFLYWAAQTVRARSAFALFNVRVRFSRIHEVPGEIMTRTSGTGMIVISPRVRTR